MNYLIQERNETCLKYPSINQNPIQHYTAMFFSNGNGVEFIDGNPVVLVEYNRSIPWTEYYSDTTSFKSIYDYIVEYEMEYEVERLYNNSLHISFGGNKSSYREIADNELRKLNNIENLSFENLIDSNFWFDCLQRKGSYYPYLNITPNYFMLQEINGNTEYKLYAIAKAVTMAYLMFFGETPKESVIANHKCLLGGKWTDDKLETIWNQASKDMQILRKEYLRLENIK